MIEYTRHQLQNGLRLIIHRDPSTPMAVVNTIFDVGSRDESPKRTGLAHLLEHLMFCGSKHVPEFDPPLLKVGGVNNAFTGPDYTDYYIQVPVQNLETAFWLESDRMSWLNLTPEGLEQEKNVVIEEFHQQYLNRPYGDVMMLLSPLVFLKHPYRWPTIGKTVDHIRDVTLEEVVEFYSRYYHPGNAILTVAGPVEPDEIIERVEHWYGEIPRGLTPERSLPQEPKMDENRLLAVQRPVPQNAIYLAWNSPSVKDPRYFAYALLADILSEGASSRFHKNLIKGEQRFSEVQAYARNGMDPGTFNVSGMLNETTDHGEAKEAIIAEIRKVAREGVDYRELQKVKNKSLFSQTAQEVGVLSKAMNLGYYELLGDASMINTHLDKYMAVTPEEIVETATELSNQPYAELRYHASVEGNGETTP